jgi:hypothetical protein
MAQDKEQKIDLGRTRTDLGREEQAFLTLTTHKYCDQLISSASVSWDYGAGLCHAYGTGKPGCGDFSQTYARNRGVRGTQANIDRQHANIFTPHLVENITLQAQAFYTEADRIAEDRKTRQAA